jgi:purine-binding chemotaxis protein CheW
MMDVKSLLSEANSASSQYLTFQVNAQRFALEILRIKEIIEFGRITVVPMMQASISGVINLRGSVVPVIDLSARFGQGKTELNRRTCIVILESQLEENTQVVGFMVDAVSAVIDISADMIAPPPQFGSGIRTDFMRAIARVDDDFVMILNVERLLDFDIASVVEDLTGTLASHADTGRDVAARKPSTATAEA